MCVWCVAATIIVYYFVKNMRYYHLSLATCLGHLGRATSHCDQDQDLEWSSQYCAMARPARPHSVAARVPKVIDACYHITLLHNDVILHYIT